MAIKNNGTYENIPKVLVLSHFHSIHSQKLKQERLKALISILALFTVNFILLVRSPSLWDQYTYSLWLKISRENLRRNVKLSHL